MAGIFIFVCAGKYFSLNKTFKNIWLDNNLEYKVWLSAPFCVVCVFILWFAFIIGTE